MDNRNEIIEQVWLRLGDIKVLLSLCNKGLDMEDKTDTGEIKSVLHIVEDLVGEVISKLDVVVSEH